MIGILNCYLIELREEFETYGYERLYEMDKEALWNDSDTIEEYIEWVMYEIEISPEC